VTDQTGPAGPEPQPDGTAEDQAPDAVGVGPWEGPLPEGERYDPDLLRLGDRRNVVDEYRSATRSRTARSVSE
jgi:hypothetical protein